jgi:adenosyl cobinamide kinase/adenosyl cobinamide phosphate guanylyltransferase
MVEAATLNEFLKAASEYGLPLVLCIGLIIYVYRKQTKLDIKTEQREQAYQGFIVTLNNTIAANTCESILVSKKICSDVEDVHDKLLEVREDIGLIKSDVITIKDDVQSIKNEAMYLEKISKERREA